MLISNCRHSKNRVRNPELSLVSIVYLYDNILSLINATFKDCKVLYHTNFVEYKAFGLHNRQDSNPVSVFHTIMGFHFHMSVFTC